MQRTGGVYHCAMSGFGGLSESSDEDEAAPQYAAPECAAALAYLRHNGWSPLGNSDHGRHNGGIFKRDGDIAKIEYLAAGAKTADMERNLQSWITAGNVPHTVTLKAFKIFPECLVTFMTQARGTEMSKVLQNSSLTFGDVLDWSKARCDAYNALGEASGFYQVDWKADNMFGEETAAGKVITFIDMPFSSVPFGGDPREMRIDTRHMLLSWWSDVQPRFQASMFGHRDTMLIRAAVSDTLANNGSSDDIFGLLAGRSVDGATKTLAGLQDFVDLAATAANDTKESAQVTTAAADAAMAESMRAATAQLQATRDAAVNRASRPYHDAVETLRRATLRLGNKKSQIDHYYRTRARAPPAADVFAFSDIDWSTRYVRPRFVDSESEYTE